jgi:hypothetical protein
MSFGTLLFSYKYRAHFKVCAFIVRNARSAFSRSQYQSRKICAPTLFPSSAVISWVVQSAERSFLCFKASFMARISSSEQLEMKTNQKRVSSEVICQTFKSFRYIIEKSEAK